MKISKINEIIRKNKEAFEILVEYDETHELPIGRERLDVTLDKKIIKKLKDLKNKTGKPISRIVEEAVCKI